MGGITESPSELETLKKELEESNAKVVELSSKLTKYESEQAQE